LYVPTRFARAKRFTGVELRRDLAQIQQDISFTSRQLIQLPVAPLAIPGVAFRFIGPPDPLHHQPDRVRRPLRRVGRIGRQQEDVPLPDGLPSPLASPVDVLQHHVAFQLVEELIAGVNVEVSPSVRATDDHDHKLGVLPDHLGPHWRLQQVTVLIDPAFEVKGSERLCHVISPLALFEISPALQRSRSLSALAEVFTVMLAVGSLRFNRDDRHPSHLTLDEMAILRHTLPDDQTAKINLISLQVYVYGKLSAS